MKKRKLEHQREVQDVVAQLRPIDDIMFQRLCENILLVEEVLRVILEDGKIKVKSVIPQSSIQNLHGRCAVTVTTISSGCATMQPASPPM